VRLRYILGGNRPSQTTHLTLSRIWIHRVRLEPQYNHSGITLTTPPGPEPGFKVSHLCSDDSIKIQYQAIVKVHGVFPSSRG
jgi:hypothetical protein